MTYKSRSDYFKFIAGNNKLIAHNQPVAAGSDKLRKSFHRINDEAELDAACRDWAHFPCMVHIGHDIRGRENGTGRPRKLIGNHLYFLSKLDSKKSPYRSDQIEAAYDQAEKVMDQFLGYLKADQEANDSCGNIFLFDLNRVRAEMIGPINESLFGWYLIFEDENKSYSISYKSNEWYQGIPSGVDDHCNCDDDTGANVLPEIIDFSSADDDLVIELTTDRKTKFGSLPKIQIWALNEDAEFQLMYVPVVTNAIPPAHSAYIIRQLNGMVGKVVLG